MDDTHDNPNLLLHLLFIILFTITMVMVINRGSSGDCLRHRILLFLAIRCVLELEIGANQEPKIL